MKKAIFDIDGVLNYYPQTYIDFCNNVYGYNFKTLLEIKETLSYIKYNELKDAYRLSTYKHNAELRDGAKEVIDYLVKNDYLIYIVTARKLFEKNQLEQTILWLRRNKIHYDYIYCTIKKDFTIFEKFDNIDILVEDTISNIQKIKEKTNSTTIFNVINNENKNIRCDGAIRINSLREILKYV